MILAAFHPLSLIDFPGKLAAVVFTQGCNMRCPYCHNPELLSREAPITGQSLAVDRFIEFLKGRKRRLDGVCITGGEPTQHADLPDFIRVIRNLGFAVKLDSNGSRPQVLRKLFEKGLLDYVAMDVKHALNPIDYARSCGVTLPLDRIQESIQLIKASGVDYEFRTTVVPDLHKPGDLLGIGRAVSGARRFALQKARPHPAMPDFMQLQMNAGNTCIQDACSHLEQLVEEVIVRD